jgi:hypothetical protein
MENTTQTNVAVIALTKKYKSQGIGFLLVVLLGSVGLVYSSLALAFILFLVEAVDGFFWVRHVLATNSDLFWSYYGFPPQYNILPFIAVIFACRFVGAIVSFFTVKGNNDKIDQLITSDLEPKQMLAGYKKYRNGKVVTALTTIGLIVLISGAVVYARIEQTKRFRREAFTSEDIQNSKLYKITCDSLNIYNSPNPNDVSLEYYEKSAIFQALKERNGFIYVGGTEDGRTVYGWLPLSGLRGVE